MKLQASTLFLRTGLAGSSLESGCCTGHFGHFTAFSASCHGLDERKSAIDVSKGPLLVCWPLLQCNLGDPLVAARVVTRRVNLAVWSPVSLSTAALLSWAEVDSTPPSTSRPRYRHSTASVGQLAPRHDGVRCHLDPACCAPAQGNIVPCAVATPLHLLSARYCSSLPIHRAGRLPHCTLAEFDSYLSKISHSGN